ncbi:hypothetical protein, partial [Modestobacter italicus]|uniref:hypothetical protein n=1 Tax=Modestobacter italicus (strain DSM 44449 / CECT 9708 / BC 501) TaxID=2732864 RepID=UPI001C94DE99
MSIVTLQSFLGTNLVSIIHFYGKIHRGNVRFEVEKFDGRINFGLWQVQVMDVLIKSGLHTEDFGVWTIWARQEKLSKSWSRFGKRLQVSKWR